MSDSDNIDLQSSEEFEKAIEAEDEKMKKSSFSRGRKRSTSGSESESEKENDTKSVKKVTRSGILWEVNVTEKELKYRSKHFKDPDDVITSRKLRCTSCNSFLQSILLEGRDIYQHPVLKVLMCKNCLEFYGDGNLSIDEDGSGKYCRWCAQGGMLYCCAECCNAFCKKCIKRNLNRSILDDIESEEWKCFVCDGKPLWELRAVCNSAYMVSKKIKRKKREENERNLLKLQKKKGKVSPRNNSRRLNNWQKNASRVSSSSDEEDDSEDDEPKRNKSKKYKKKRKRHSTSSSSDGGKPTNKKKKQHTSDSDIAVIESEKECIVVEDTDDGLNKKTPRKSKDNSKEDELPDVVDSEGVKEANSLLTEHLSDIINTGELIAYRAKRLLEKKVSESDLVDPKKVDKVVGSVNLLVKLAGENMQHTVDFLTSQHAHWVKQVKKRHRQTKRRSKTVDNTTDATKKNDTNDDDDAQGTPVVNGDISSVCESSVSTETVKKQELKNNALKRKTGEENDSEEVDDSEAGTVIAAEEKQTNKKPKMMLKTGESSHDEKVVSKESIKDAELPFEDSNKIHTKSGEMSEESFTSMSTLKVKLNDSQLDIFAEDKDESIPLEGDDTNCKLKYNEVLEKTTKEADSSDDAATIELLCSQGSDKDNDIVKSVPETDDGSANCRKKRKKSEDKDSAMDESVVDPSNEDCDLLLNKSNLGSETNDQIAEEKSSKNEQNEDVNHNVNAVSDVESDNDICKPDDGKDSDIGNLQLSDSVSESDTAVNKPEECDDSEGDEKEKKEEFTDECFGAQEALLGYTSDDEDDDDEKRVKKRKKKEKTKKAKEVDEKKKEDSDMKTKKKRPIGPKSKTRQFVSSSSSATDVESDSSATTMKREENIKKKKFRLKDTEAYKKDKKLGWCTVDVERLSEEEFQKYYENYYSEEEDEVAKKVKDDKEIESLVNLKYLRKGKGKRSEESSDDSEKIKKKRNRKKDKKEEQEQRLIDFFNEDDDNVAPDDASDQFGSDSDTAKPMKKKDIIERDNEMAMKLLLESPSDDDNDESNKEEEDTLKDEKKKKKKSKEEVEESEDDDKTDIAEVNESDKMDVEDEKTEGDKADEEEKKSADEDEKKSADEDEKKSADEEEKKSADEEEKKSADEEEKKSADEEEKKSADEEEKKSADEEEKKSANEEENDSDKAKVKEEKEEMETEVKKEDSEENDKKEESNENENDEEDDKDKKDKGDDSDGSVKSKKQNKKDWRKDKLLTEKLTDLDTSDEERLWKKKKQKENKEDSKKKVKRRILGSDDEDFKISSISSESESESKKSSSGSDSDIFVIKQKKKKKGKKSDSDDNTDSSSDFKTKKPKRRRIKAPATDTSSDDEDGPSQTSGTPGKGRKKIHHIMSDDNVAEATRRAAKEEEERRKRIAEKQKLYNEICKEVEGGEKIDKLILDFDLETKKELVSVDPNIVSKLKPHQAQGVKFMWDACYESLKHIKKNKGSGCILAHCMGLGKTLQIVSLVHTLLRYKQTQVHTILVICPLSTVLNWCNEFNKWLKDGEINVFELTRYKQNYERQYQLKEWMDCGGVMVLGYDMYRNLTNPHAKRMRKKAIETFQSTLVDPGPDLVVCDEGHVLKNEDSAIARALRKIKTLRRIVLTGTPLQNNLKEYHCMVQFVKPNLLGTRKEFLNRFVNPISNGQFEDSTPHDVKIMKRRAHVLHKMLEASVQRFDYSVLMPFLPPKQEYVISIRLHESQVKAYRHYLDFFSRRSDNKGAQLFTDFNNLQRIWTHPRVLQMSADREEKVAEKKRMDLDSEGSEGSLIDFIDDNDASSDSSNESSVASSNEDSDIQIVGGENKTKKNKSNKYTRTTRSKGPVEEPPKDVTVVEKEDKEATSLWWKQFIQGNELETINCSGKLMLLFSILRECEKIGDKVLVFSQSLFSLNLIEHFLGQIDAATQNGEQKEELGNHTGSWSVGLDYFRLDGSTSSENRHIWCKSFNREDNHRSRLFLISTRAGGLGINLYAANRVIIFDASWNPSHDVQSIFRVYRFGQKKPCYIYRFLAQGTMEEKIYDRQVTKLSLSCRVVDEQQIERHYNMADLQELYQFDPEQKTKRPTPILPKDRLLAELLKEHEQWIVTYHEHDSLLENKEGEELDEDERKAAWEEYENEKKGKVVTNAQGMPGPGLNMQALREALKNENPQATPEELEQKMSLIMGQIYEYLNNQQNAATQQKYTAAQLQALQQYQIQQQHMRAQREKQMRMHQDLTLRTALKTPGAYNQGTNVSFQQYLQNQKTASMNNMLGNYQNLYRNPNLDKAGVLRVQSKLVPIDPNSAAASRLMNFGMQDMVPNHLAGRPPVMLPQSSVDNSMKVIQKLFQGNPAAETKEKQDLNKKSVPDDVVETIE